MVPRTLPVEGDKPKLLRILHNLLLNAISVAKLGTGFRIEDDLLCAIQFGTERRARLGGPGGPARSLIFAGSGASTREPRSLEALSDVVEHSDGLAERLGEDFGVATRDVSAMEMMGAAGGIEL